MKQESLISVVMPVFNGGKYLREAIESILNQTYQNFEFLIINDGSTDESDEIIRSYTAPRIIYLQNDRNRGLVYTLNFGISIAKGEYITRMDADDISEPTRFEKQIEAFEKDPELGLCGTWGRIVGSSKVLRIETEDERIKCGLFFTNQFIHSSIMFRKSELAKSGQKYQEEDFTAEDYALWIHLSRSVKMINIAEPLLNYRMHSAQISTASSEKQIKKTHELHLFQIRQFLNYNPTEEEKSTHLLFLNFRLYIKGKSDIERIHDWLVKLENINNINRFYKPFLFNESLREYFGKRFIHQNYNNNNPLFIPSFYLAYSHSRFKLNLLFHLQFIVKCLIFYKRYKI